MSAKLTVAGAAWLRDGLMTMPQGLHLQFPVSPQQLAKALAEQ